MKLEDKQYIIKNDDNLPSYYIYGHIIGVQNKRNVLIMRADGKMKYLISIEKIQ